MERSNQGHCSVGCIHVQPYPHTAQGETRGSARLDETYRREEGGDVGQEEVDAHLVHGVAEVDVLEEEGGEAAEEEADDHGPWGSPCRRVVVMEGVKPGASQSVTTSPGTAPRLWGPTTNEHTKSINQPINQ